MYSFPFAEAKRQRGAGDSHHSSSVSALSPPVSSLFLSVQQPAAVVREGRSFSASTVLQAPSIPARMAAKKSPKLWHRRNAHVTPLNGPAPLYGEWPLVGFDPLEEFSKLHDYYGQEVKKAREEWLRSRQAKEEHSDEDLIDLGWKKPHQHWQFRKERNWDRVNHVCQTGTEPAGILYL